MNLIQRLASVIGMAMSIVFVVSGPSGAANICPTEFADVPHAAGGKIACSCEPLFGKDYKLWGTGIYTDDSTLCAAAVHAGMIDASGGNITAYEVPGQDSYSGSFSNNLTSHDYGSWEGAFTFLEDMAASLNPNIAQGHASAQGQTITQGQNFEPGGAYDGAWKTADDEGFALEIEIVQGPDAEMGYGNFSLFTLDHKACRRPRMEFLCEVISDEKYMVIGSQLPEISFEKKFGDRVLRVTLPHQSSFGDEFAYLEIKEPTEYEAIGTLFDEGGNLIWEGPMIRDTHYCDLLACAPNRFNLPSGNAVSLAGGQNAPASPNIMDFSGTWKAARIAPDQGIGETVAVFTLLPDITGAKGSGQYFIDEGICVPVGSGCEWPGALGDFVDVNFDLQSASLMLNPTADPHARHLINFDAVSERNNGYYYSQNGVFEPIPVHVFRAPHAQLGSNPSSSFTPTPSPTPAQSGSSQILQSGADLLAIAGQWAVVLVENGSEGEIVALFDIEGVPGGVTSTYLAGQGICRPVQEFCEWAGATGSFLDISEAEGVITIILNPSAGSRVRHELAFDYTFESFNGAYVWDHQAQIGQSVSVIRLPAGRADVLANVMSQFNAEVIGSGGFQFPMAGGSESVMGGQAVDETHDLPAHVAMPGNFICTHNNSVMSLAIDDNYWEISYLLPREGLSSIGVMPGTLLVAANENSGLLSGAAHVFSAACGAASYEVSGPANSNGRMILRGPAPVRQNCQITSYSWEKSSSELVFDCRPK